MNWWWTTVRNYALIYCNFHFSSPKCGVHNDLPIKISVRNEWNGKKSGQRRLTTQLETQSKCYEKKRKEKTENNRNIRSIWIVIANYETRIVIERIERRKKKRMKLKKKMDLTTTRNGMHRRRANAHSFSNVKSFELRIHITIVLKIYSPRAKIKKKKYGICQFVIGISWKSFAVCSMFVRYA